MENESRATAPPHDGRDKSRVTRPQEVKSFCTLNLFVVPLPSAAARCGVLDSVFVVTVTPVVNKLLTGITRMFEQEPFLADVSPTRGRRKPPKLHATTDKTSLPQVNDELLLRQKSRDVVVPSGELDDMLRSLVRPDPQNQAEVMAKLQSWSRPNFSTPADPRPKPSISAEKIERARKILLNEGPSCADTSRGEL